MSTKSFIFPVIIIGILLIFRALHSVLLFHTLVELITIFVGLLMLVVVKNTRSFIKNDFLLFLGIMYCGISVIDLMHVFTVKGMPFGGYQNAEVTVRLWVCARFFEACVLLYSPLVLGRRLNQPLAIAIALFMIVISVFIGFYTTYPKMFNATGLSAFKVGSEYFIMGMFALTMIILQQKRADIAPYVLKYIQASLALKIGAEFCFTLYSDFHGIAFVIGHVAKFLSFWLIYVAIIRTALKSPISLLSQQSNSYDAIPISAISVDENGVIHQLNREVLSEFNMTRESLMYQPIHELFHPQTLIDGRCRYCEAIENHHNISNEEVYLERYHRWFLISIASIDKQAKHKGMVQSLTNISTQKAHESQLQRHQHDLEQTVKGRTIELQKSFDELVTTQEKLLESKKMASLGGLVAGIAHEINTPIGVSLTAASYLDESTKQITQKLAANEMKRSEFERYINQAQDGSELIINNLQRAAKLIGSFKQVAVDQSSEQTRSFAIKEYIQEVLTSLKPTLRNYPVTVSFDLADDFSVTSSPSAISQIITNLIMNSLKHGFDDGSSGIITLSVTNEDEIVTLLFSDSGKGIPEEHLAKIYEPFFTTKRAQGGSGLGMNIIFNLVNHTIGGHISCRSQLGEGTQFEITFPQNINSSS